MNNHLKMLLVLIIGIAFLANTFVPCQSAIENSDSNQYSEADLMIKANGAFWKRNYACAKNYCLQLLDDNTTKVSKARLLVNIAICDSQMDNWDLAAKEAKQGIDIACDDPLAKSDGLLVAGRCYVVARKIDQAQEAYSQSLSIASKQLGDWNCDLAPIYEGLAACEYSHKNMQAAKTLYKKAAQLDYLKFGPDGTQLAWSLLSLCNALEALHENDQAHILYKKVFWNFRHQNEERIIEEANLQDADKEALLHELRKQLYGYNNGYENRLQGLDYLKQDIPTNVLKDSQSRLCDFNDWFSDRAGRDTAPGLAFFDPRTKLKALIVTIHGLGLHHGAFTPFAEQTQHKGFGVISFDVRGFGSYRNDEIYQRVDFKAIISDLQRILTSYEQIIQTLLFFFLVNLWEAPLPYDWQRSRHN